MFMDILYYKTDCACMCLSVCQFPHLSISFACMGLKFCRRAQGPREMVHAFFYLKFPRGGNIMNELMGTFEFLQHMEK